MPLLSYVGLFPIRELSAYEKSLADSLIYLFHKEYSPHDDCISSLLQMHSINAASRRELFPIRELGAYEKSC